MTTEELPLILVADDDPDMLALVTRHLRTMKCRLVEATDGDAALAAAKKERPDLVVLDVMMPGKSGWEVCKELRDDPTFRDTAIVMLTGIGEQLNALTSPLYGADACVDKPFEFGELDFKIKKVLSDRRRAKAERDSKDVTRPMKTKNKRV